MTDTLTPEQEEALCRLTLAVNAILETSRNAVLTAEQIAEYNEAEAACRLLGISQFDIQAFTTAPASSDLRPPQPGFGGGGSSSEEGAA